MEATEENRFTESQKSGIHVMQLLLTAKDVARLFGINELTLANWRCAGIGLEYIKIGSSVRYTHQAIERYLREQTIKPSVREDAASHDYQKGQSMALQVPDRREAV